MDALPSFLFATDASFSRRNPSMLWLWALVLSLAVSGSAAEPLELLSVRHPALPASVGGNGDSVEPVVTPDGRFVLFASTANNLVTNDDAQFGMDVFLHDRESGRTTLVSVNTNGTGGGDGHSDGAVVSADGRWVAFASFSENLKSGDTNGRSDVYLRDVIGGATHLVSVGSNGRAGSGSSDSPSISADGRFVAFASSVSNLVSGDTNRFQDVFVRDVTAGVTRLAGSTTARFRSNASAIGGDDPVLARNGSRIFFFSNATNLVAGVEPSLGEVYARDLGNLSLICASRGARQAAFPGVPASRVLSRYPAVSEDGTCVVFLTVVSNTPSSAVLFRRLADNAPILLTTNGVFGSWDDAERFRPALSQIGLFAAFVEEGPVDGVLRSVVCRWSAASGLSSAVEFAEGGSGGSWAAWPSLSSDGRFVFFTGTIQGTGTQRIYRHDTTEGTTTSFGAGSSQRYPSRVKNSDSGGIAVFAATDSGASSREEQVLLITSASNSEELVSRSMQSGPAVAAIGSSLVDRATLSADGRWVAFTSFSDQLNPDDAKGFLDVFVRDRMRNITLLASGAHSGGAAQGGHSFNPVLSGDGRYLVFLSQATNLVADGGMTNVHLYRRDLLTGRTRLVSADTNGTGFLPHDVTTPSISHDGRYVSFSAQKGLNELSCWRDMETNRTVCLSTNASVGVHPALSSNGLRIAYHESGRIKVWDATFRRNIFTNSTQTFSQPYLSPDGMRLVASGAGSSFTIQSLVPPFSASTINVANLGSVASHGREPWLGDSRNYLVTTYSNGIGAVRTFDTLTGTNTIVSHALGSAQNGNGSSYSPVAGRDGRFIVFRSSSSNLVAGVGAGNRYYLHDRNTGSNATLFPPELSQVNGQLSIQRISANAEAVVIGSRDVAGSGDRNRASDVMALPLVPLDSDRDEIADTWERDRFGTLDRDGTDDWDQDGLDDAGEYLAGTQPKNDASKLELQMQPPMNGRLLFVWPATREADSRLEYTESLLAPDWQPLPGYLDEENGWFRLLSEPAAQQTNLFFRISVRP